MGVSLFPAAFKEQFLRQFARKDGAKALPAIKNAMKEYLSQRTKKDSPAASSCL